MADIDKFKPLSPIWPVRPGRKVEYDDPPPAEIKKQKKHEDSKDSTGSDDDSHHVDEYA